MGFTIVGPDQFLGSWHSDVAGMRAGQPGRLGLIESTDTGPTLTSIFLSDEVDFHGLAFAHDRSGWDSGTGRFMVSTDRTDWETRSTLDMFGFAVDPDDAEHVVGAAPASLTESADGDCNWAGTPPPLERPPLRLALARPGFRRLSSPPRRSRDGTTRSTRP